MKRSNIYEPRDITCAVCGKNLLDNIGLSLVQINLHPETKKIIRVFPCCKGDCDERLQGAAEYKNYEDGWEEFSEFLNPYTFMKHIMAVMNNMHEGKGFETQEALEAYKQLILSCYPYIARHMTEAEMESAKVSGMRPF